MLTRTTTVGGAIAVVAVLATPQVARADGWGTVDCGQAPTPQCQIEAGASASSPGRPSDQADGPKPGGGAEGNQPVCEYAPSEFEAFPGAPGWRPPGTWYQGACSLTDVIRPPVEGAGVAPEYVARLARAQLDLPSPRLASSPAGEQLVHLPTWLWLADGWEPVSATATVPGVSVTATAKPELVTWLMGDGAITTCEGPGTRFRTGMNPRSASPDCGHTYRRSSASQPGGAYLVQATVRWSVTWEGAGQTGTFPPMTTTSQVALRVAESQALNTLPGPR
ncbi:hypothetical protein [Actinophytocola sp. KF-1]